MHTSPRGTLGIELWYHSFCETCVWIHFHFFLLKLPCHDGRMLNRDQYDISRDISYTLSHPENDRDVTDLVQEYTLQDAFFMRQSRCSFLNA